MNRKTRLTALLLCCGLALTGCVSSPPEQLIREGAAGQALISAHTEDLVPDTRSVALFFRCGNLPYLASEERQIQVQRNESLEKAMVQALINGPASPSSSLSGLFPPGTEVLAAVTQGDTLFVTFNEAFLGKYADEPGDPSAGDWAREGPLRRQLCLDALGASMVEAGLCAKVQVLVYQGGGQSTSMRLQEGFLTRNGSAALLPPVTRREDCLLTPHNTGALLLEAWMHQNWEELYDLTAREGASARPGEQSALDAFSAAGALAGFTLSPGNVAYDGKTAVLTADLRLRGAGEDVVVAGYPLVLVRDGGLWKMDYEKLLALLSVQ